jgi:hypothetical protein
MEINFLPCEKYFSPVRFFYFSRVEIFTDSNIINRPKEKNKPEA